MGEEIKVGNKAVNELEATINAETTTEQEATSEEEFLDAANTQNVKEQSKDGITYLFLIIFYLISCLSF